MPREVPAQEKHLHVWQAYAWEWQAYSEDLVSQRLDTAECLQTLRTKRVIN